MSNLFQGDSLQSKSVNAINLFNHWDKHPKL